MSQQSTNEALEPGQPRDPDSTIRILKAFYKMGDLDAMQQYIVLWNLADAEKTEAQAKEANLLVDLMAEMKIFEREHGQGGCLQLEHESVQALMSENFYPGYVLENASKGTWEPTPYQGWEYPRFPRRKTSALSKLSNNATLALSGAVIPQYA
jgi:hypothetical protein